MKILYHHRIASKDGQYVHVEELTKALRRLGHDLLMVGPAVVEQDSFGSDGGLVSVLKRWLPRWIYELLEFAYAVRAYLRLASAAAWYRPDFLYERYNLFMPAGVWVKRRFRLPMILEVNAPLFEERSRYGGIALKALARWTEQYTWRNADLVLPVTQVLADHVRRAGVPNERIVVIPNGIDPARFIARENPEAAKQRLGLAGQTVLGFTGFVRDWHGLDRVVDLLAKPEAGQRHLLIVGDGPARASIEAKAAELGVTERVTITGIVERDAVASYVAAFDIALQPDVVAYASPLKLFEYLAMGCAVVAPDSANIREILTDDQNGLLFDASSREAFTAAVEKLCVDKALRQRFSQAAVATIVEKNLTWESNAERVIGLARSLTQQGGRPLATGLTNDRTGIS